MGALKVMAVNCRQPIASSHSSSAPQHMTAPPLRRCSRSEGALPSLLVQRADPTPLFGSEPRPLTRSTSCEQLKLKTRRSACKASLNDFSPPDFSRDIQNLMLRFRSSHNGKESPSLRNSRGHRNSVKKAPIEMQEWPSLSDIRQDSVFWAREEMVPAASIEWKANRVDIPVSLRLLKRKMKPEECLTGASKTTYTPMNKAFSSTVFIIRELQSYALQMREVSLYENLEEILVRAQEEMIASFVWLFQQVFSQTPTLMVYVMVLLANYSVHSIDSAAGSAVSPPAATYSVQDHESNHRIPDACSVSTSVDEAASVSGSNGGGTYSGDKLFSISDEFRQVVVDGMLAASMWLTKEEESTSGQAVSESELSKWNSMVEEACRLSGDSVDGETKRSLVAPVTANLSMDDYPEHLRTELFYQMSLSEDRNNALILSNYAQFLYLVAEDYDRAEEYFKKAVMAEPVDAEARNKYAMFLWRAREDLWAAEENFLEAISAEPENTYYAAGYANFLWNTGGEDTCFPLDSQDAAHQTEA